VFVVVHKTQKHETAQYGNVINDLTNDPKMINNCASNTLSGESVSSVEEESYENPTSLAPSNLTTRIVLSSSQQHNNNRIPNPQLSLMSMIFDTTLSVYHDGTSSNNNNTELSFRNELNTMDGFHRFMQQDPETNFSLSEILAEALEITDTTDRNWFGNDTECQ
jgi:hypothetical protein